MGDLKVSVLVENTVGVPSSLISEWGLAMLLDFGDERILFDTGEQGNIANNAQIMGIDLKSVSRVILSHGHYDHTGGILEFLKIRGKVSVYAHPDLFSDHYSRGINGSAPNHCTGLPMASRLAAELPSKFRWAVTGKSLEF